MNSFENLALIEPIKRALRNEGYTNPTPIQAQSIPVILDKKDLLGCAQTGTGKTAAFIIPILQRLFEEKREESGRKNIKSLILTPTRELAIQIGEKAAAYGKYTGISSTVIFGGVSQKPQTDALRRGTDILIATPGRLLDLMSQKFISLQHIRLFVLDEADRMLDMGFIHDVKKVISKLPAKRQSMFFSATMPPEIKKLSETILTSPAFVAVNPVSSTVDIIKQEVYYVDKANKKNLLVHLLKGSTINTALVFTRTKHGADKVARELVKAGIVTEAIHGNKSQSARQRALSNFKMKTTRVLVATDIAARGIDIENLSHVINFEISNVPETYVHRIGRTGRAGSAGVAISFCDREEREYLRGISKLTSRVIPVIEDHPFAASLSVPAAANSGSDRRPTGDSANKARSSNRNKKPSRKIYH